MNTGFLRHAVATVLTVYGIETLHIAHRGRSCFVATVLTVYGIETTKLFRCTATSCKLQQCLPFTVLKLVIRIITANVDNVLQQCLPFTVLKLLE